jgi:hypothetical protein
MCSSVDADPSVNWYGRSLPNSIAVEIHQIFNRIQLLSNNTIKLSTLKVYSIQARHGRLRTIQVKAIPAALQEDHLPVCHRRVRSP